jgi:hypothetical protein
MARWLHGWRIVVVNDAYKALPRADILYACDFQWWRVNGGAKGFTGERWTSHSHCAQLIDDKSLVENEFPLNFINARHEKGFSTDPGYVHYGSPEHSGFQAVNLAAIMGAVKIVLVGFDYAYNGKAHFFGDHPQNLRQPKSHEYAAMAKAFDSVSTNIEILNATPNSGLKKFQFMELSEALHWNDSLHRDRSESLAATG